jgi:hypothetical protein
LFILPVTLGDCEVPRKLRQYHTVNLADPGAVEMLLRSLSSAIAGDLCAAPDAVANLRDLLLGHLGAEGASNQEFVERFMQTDEISFQDSMALIERIANSNDPKRLQILLKLRAEAFLSYAEQAALDKAIDNVKAGNRTENLQSAIRADEIGRIAQMVVPGNLEATRLLQLNKYVRYVSRKNTDPYRMAAEKIQNLLTGRD